MTRSAPIILLLLVGGLQVCVAADTATQPARVGILLPGTPHQGVEYFRQGMREFGYVEGKNLLIEERWAKGRWDEVPGDAKQLVDLKVDIIVTATTRAALIARQATQTIPIVLAASDDPVRAGLAASLARPGGNVTGLTIMLEELCTKRLELLRELLPKAKRVAFLHDTSLDFLRERLQAAARGLRMQIDFIAYIQPDEFERALNRIAAGRYDAVLVFEEPIAFSNRARIARFADAHRLPGMYGGALFVRAGGLISYAPDFDAMFKSAAGYVDRILKGANPADLPIEQPSQFKLAVNLKTAKALGISIPESILIRADEVIR
jgi:putative tryptophan/tyrosine transport system substrate-binding protein